jgi:hypothetical protein
MASNKGLTKNVILWSYSSLSFYSGRQIVDTVYSRKQGSSYQIWNFKFIHLWNLEVFEEHRKKIFLCFLKCSFLTTVARKWRHHETVAFSLWVGWENGGLSYIWKEIIRSHFNEETPRSGKIFCLYFLLWFLCRFFNLHSSPLQLCLHIILTSSSLSLSWAIPHSLFLCDSDEISRDLQQRKKKERSEMNWKSLPIFRLFFPASSFESLLHTEICWMAHWLKI